MPKIKVVDNGHGWWLVRIEYPDMDTKGFLFEKKDDALVAIELARYFRDNELSLKDIEFVK